MGAGRQKGSSHRWNSSPPSPSSSTRPVAPSSFLCPIHLDIMADPVTLHTGMTYDRCSIETWLTAGNNTCPATNQPLRHCDLIPNHALRRAINTWSTANTPPNIQPLTLNDFTALLLSISIPSSLHRLATELPHLEDDHKQALFRDSRHSSHALAARLSFLVSSRSSSSRGKLHAAEVLHALCEADPSHVGAHPDTIAALTTILKEVEDEEEEFEEGDMLSALKCMLSLCRWNTKNRVVAIECDAVSVLMELMVPGTESGTANVELCCGVLECLANCAEGREAIREHPVGVATVVEAVLGVSDVATEHAVGALWGVVALAVDRRSVMDVALQAGVFPVLLMVMSSECSSRAKGLAREMLKMLNEVFNGSCGGAEVGLLRRRHQSSKKS